jgi:hypothetical protein
LSLGLASSILASLLTFLIFYGYRKRKDRKRFSKAAGEYLGFEPSQDNNRELREEPISEAQVTYEGENRLRIILTHDQGARTWEGLITMANDHYGSLGFQYRNMPQGQYEFGFKRCIVSVSGNELLLINEAPPRGEGEIVYGREVLIRRNTRHGPDAPNGPNWGPG